jgi:hypothetical protein
MNECNLLVFDERVSIRLVHSIAIKDERSVISQFNNANIWYFAYSRI